MEFDINLRFSVPMMVIRACCQGKEADMSAVLLHSLWCTHCISTIHIQTPPFQQIFQRISLLTSMLLQIKVTKPTKCLLVSRSDRESFSNSHCPSFESAATEPPTTPGMPLLFAEQKSNAMTSRTQRSTIMRVYIGSTRHSPTGSPRVARTV